MKKVNRTAFEDFDGGFGASMNCNVVAAVVATGAVTAAVSSDASRHAANVQSDAANAASQNAMTTADKTNALQWQMYQQNLKNNQPGMQAGQTALAALSGGLGLGSQFTSNGQATSAGTTGTSGMATIGGTPTQGIQSVSADGTPSTGAQNSLFGSQTPGGTTNYGATADQMGQAAAQYNDVFTKPFTADSLSIDPSYQFRLQQGNQALAARQAASGTYLTGQGLKDVSDYNQGAASQEYQAAFNRDQTTKNALYDKLSALAGVGQAATAGSNAAGATAAGNIANTANAATGASNNYLTSGAASQAAGAVGQANAWNSAINNGTNAYSTMQILNGQNNPWAKSGVAQRGATSDQITLSDGSTFSA